MSCDGDEAAAVDEGDGCGGGMVRWERFLPRVSLRVLLVEKDESTRQVIAALLRKCSYKVAAVSDGLKAWEVLKGKPNSIDIILSETELPSISGFALLTLIMEHDSCKNIPVIIMSKNDSVNMVYKCMLRGAADFLVKPVRKNELQNLWQHVWRRQAVGFQSASSGQGVSDKSIMQQEVKGLLDNDLPIIESNCACTPENKECNEKGNNAQSSCSVPDREAESAFEIMQSNSKSKFNKLVARDTDEEQNCVRGDSVALKPGSVAKGSSINIPEEEDAVIVIEPEDADLEKLQEDRNTFSEASDNNDALINGSREAVDLIGTFQNQSTKSFIKPSVNNATSENDSCSRLDLSLRRYDDNALGHQDITVDERRHGVHQSNASAFSRYQALKATHHAQACALPRECEGSSDKHMASPIQSGNPYHSTSCLDTHKNTLYQASGELRHGELPFPCPQLKMIPVMVPVKGMGLDRTCTSYGSSLHPSYYNYTGGSPTPSPDSGGQREVLSRAIQVPDPNISSCSNHTALRQDMDFEHMKNVSSVNERSQNSSLCNGAISRLNSIGGGSNSSGNPIAESKAEGISTQDENTNRSLQREAALNKFRLKRKDRCFEKKVRYESRKKLAEQRPRAKGQFVRQMPTDPSTVTTSDS